MLDAIIVVLAFVLGWVSHGFYTNGCEVKKKGFKPLNQRGERLRLFR